MGVILLAGRIRSAVPTHDGAVRSASKQIFSPQPFFLVRRLRIRNFNLRSFNVNGTIRDF